MATALLWMCRRGQSFFLGSEKPAVLRRTIHTSVWWDFNSSEVPEGADPSSIPGNITAALAKLNYGAPLTFSAYGDWCYHRFFAENLEALSKRGIKVKYVNSFRRSPYLPRTSTSIPPALVFLSFVCSIFFSLIGDSTSSPSSPSSFSSVSIIQWMSCFHFCSLILTWGCR